MKKVISLVLLLVLAASFGCAQAQALDGAVVGSTVTFGNYEQGNGQVPIEWIVLETSTGSQMKALTPGEKPQAVFALADGEKAVAAYAYCNLHGLWKAEV